VRGRNSDNDLIRKELGWAPTQSLYGGLSKTYPWIESQRKTYGEELKEAVVSA